MKILILAPQPFYQNRGTPIAVRLLAEVLGQNGHEVHLLVFHEGEDVEMPNVTIHRIPSLPGLSGVPPGFSIRKIICDGLLWAKSISLQRAIRFDFLHAVEEAVFIARLNRMFFRVPYIYDMDSCLSDQLLSRLSWLQPLRRLLEGIENRAVRDSAGVVAVCRALEEKVRQQAAGKPLVRLEDISLLPACPDPAGGESLRESLAVTGKLLLYVGNLETYQGIDLLLEGFAGLAKRRGDCALVIIGGSEPDIARYRDKCRRLGLDGLAFLIGPRPVHLLGGFLSQADAVVSPRIQGENTPMKIYSYLDSGRPVVATRIISHTQVLDDTIAVLVEPDPLSLAQGLFELLDNETMAAQLATAAKKRVAQQFSRPVFAKKLTGFYQQLISASPPNR